MRKDLHSGLWFMIIAKLRVYNQYRPDKIINQLECLKLLKFYGWWLIQSGWITNNSPTWKNGCFTAKHMFNDDVVRSLKSLMVDSMHSLKVKYTTNMCFHCFHQVYQVYMMVSWQFFIEPILVFILDTLQNKRMCTYIYMSFTKTAIYKLLNWTSIYQGNIVIPEKVSI